MKLKSKKTVFLLLFCMFSFFQSQEKKDSLYHKIEEFSNKRKAAKFLYRFVFRRTPDSVSIPTKNAFEVKQNFDGKTIRNIKIVTIDPFGNASNEVIENEKWYADYPIGQSESNNFVESFLLEDGLNNTSIFQFRNNRLPS